ncbi:hypothetical protein SAMN05216228_1013115 [Rhizobium tibeticum]|uniref:Uncharacterized protein n=1 Tax=Rhizobium tibeticum TaxID=501024 RepID=A0A1H8MX96_9HYPH|nr:hypothetical protein RTCCBAU85039_4433 [Rhizobium tibeticum]SEO22011.1 hypothetical protein SAMN05216228_1013115 [Rhizobium tibeticum]
MNDTGAVGRNRFIFGILERCQLGEIVYVSRWKRVAESDCAGTDRGESKLLIQYLFARQKD